MFDTHDDLYEALTASNTLSALYTALIASTPPVAARAHTPN
ncbi:hypothetical protein [Streptomyces agglomeratus]|nr:hypothetical protein [Streptomyces agglomeratus]